MFNSYFNHLLASLLSWLVQQGLCWIAVSHLLASLFWLGYWGYWLTSVSIICLRHCCVGLVTEAYVKQLFLSFACLIINCLICWGLFEQLFQSFACFMVVLSSCFNCSLACIFVLAWSLALMLFKQLFQSFACFVDMLAWFVTWVKPNSCFIASLMLAFCLSYNWIYERDPKICHSTICINFEAYIGL